MTVVYVLSAGASGMIAWRLLVQALSLNAGNQVTILLGLWLYPFVLIAFIACALLTLVYIILLINTVGGMKK